MSIFQQIENFVIDTERKQIWKLESIKMSWWTALRQEQYEWTLPTAKQLKRIWELEAPGFIKDYYWTNSAYSIGNQFGDYAWCIRLTDGNIYNEEKERPLFVCYIRPFDSYTLLELGFNREEL